MMAGPPPTGSSGDSGTQRVPRADADVERDDGLSEADQTLADGDQTLSDADQTLSESDQTDSDVDQWAADQDQLASNRDLGSGVDPLAHELTRDMRAQSTRHRQRASEARMAAAERR